jgi:hypothetical protein
MVTRRSVVTASVLGRGCLLRRHDGGGRLNIRLTIQIERLRRGMANAGRVSSIFDRGNGLAYVSHHERK